MGPHHRPTSAGILPGDALCPVGWGLCCEYGTGLFFGKALFQAGGGVAGYCEGGEYPQPSHALQGGNGRRLHGACPYPVTGPLVGCTHASSGQEKIPPAEIPAGLNFFENLVSIPLAPVFESQGLNVFPIGRRMSILLYAIADIGLHLGGIFGL